MNDHLLKTALGYRRFTGPPRLLVLDTGYYIVRDVMDAAGELGYPVASVPARLRGRGEDHFVAELLGTLVRHRPDFVFTVNHLGFDEDGVLSQLLSGFQVPIASWFVDHPFPILGGSPSNVVPTCQVFCVERSALGWLAGQGYRDPVHLPSASNGRHFRPGLPAPVGSERERALGSPLCFVGHSWWEKARQERPSWMREPLRALRPQTIDKGLVRDRLPAVFEQGPPPSQKRGRYLMAQVALAEAAMQERTAFVRALAPLGLRVYGDAHWHKLVPGLDLAPSVDPTAELPAVFARSGINANITSVHLPTAVNQRVFDVPAVGGFLLTDAQEDLRELFGEDQVAVYSDLGELKDQVRHYLAHPEARQAIAERARGRVEQAHRYTHRLRRLCEIMRARFA